MYFRKSAACLMGVLLCSSVVWSGEGVSSSELGATQVACHTFIVRDAEVRNDSSRESDYPCPYPYASLKERVGSAEQAIEGLRGELQTVKESIPTDCTGSLTAIEVLRGELKYSLKINKALQDISSLTLKQMVCKTIWSPYTVPKFVMSSFWSWCRPQQKA